MPETTSVSRYSHAPSALTELPEENPGVLVIMK